MAGALVVSGTAIFAQEPLPRGSASIEGRVIDGATRRPVPGAIVDLEVAAPEQSVFRLGWDGTGHVDSGGTSRVATLVADGNGNFQFTGLPREQFVLRAALPGYMAGLYGQVEWNGADRWLAVRQGERVTGIDVPIWRDATVRGRVFDSRGRPVAGVDVRASGIGILPKHPGRQWTETDDLGVFTLRVDPGEHFISALSFPHSREAMFPYRDSEGKLLFHRTTYYPQTAAFTDARPIRIRPGEALTEINIHLVASHIEPSAASAAGRPVGSLSQELEDAARRPAGSPVAINGQVRLEPPLERTRPWVTVFPSDTRLCDIEGTEGFQIPRIAYLRTGTSLRFSTSLPAGDYFVIATDKEVAPLRGAADCAALLPQATSMKLIEGSNVLELTVVAQQVRR